MKSILFVCTANTCRSFMTEQLMRQLLEERGLSGSIKVASAGILALSGLRPPENALRALKEAGVKPRDHKVRQFDRDMLCEADVVLVMEKSHKEQILKDYPSFNKKVYLLKEFAGLGDGEILDPVGCSYEAYETCLSEIRTALFGVIERLVKGGI